MRLKEIVQRRRVQSRSIPQGAFMHSATRTKLVAAAAIAVGFASFGTASMSRAEQSEKAGKPAAAATANAAVLAAQILARWEPVAEAAGAHYAAWKEVFGTQLALMDLRSLSRLDALKADVATAKADYARFTQAFLDAQFNRVMNAESEKGSTKLGTANTDLVFVPIVPCRIVDTRNAGGQISAGQTRNFWYYSDNGAYNFGTGQGGIPGAVGTVCPQIVYSNNAPRFGAAAMTVQVVSPSAAGNWIIWGGANPQPTISALNWTGPGQILTNTTIVPGGGRSGTGLGGGIQDFAVSYNGPSGSAHFIADVVGYFVENAATALSCVYLYNPASTNVPANSDACADPPACTAGYTQTGALFDNVSFGGLVMSQLNANVAAGTAMCARNTSGTAKSFTAGSICCRVPGR